MPIFFSVNRSLFRPKKRTGVKKFEFTPLVRDYLFLIREPRSLFIKGSCKKGLSERQMGGKLRVSEKRSLVMYQSPSSEKHPGRRSPWFFAGLT